MAALLDVRELTVEFGTEAAPFRAVDGVDLQVVPGEIVGIVGESGSGKSVTALALMGLIDFPGRVRADALEFLGCDLLAVSERERRAIVGRDIAMIFQDPMTSLNPSYTAGYQLMEALAAHQGGSRAARRAAALDLLKLVEIPDAASRLDAYPHQLSGGMSQRVMIAMALACNPKLLIADEPTTALDVTVQAQILELLRRLQRERGMALLLITHDLAVVAEMAHRVIVMYAGKQVETGPLPATFERPHHPYTEALLAALPEHNAGRARLATIPGVVPGAFDRPAGCLLSPRCAYAVERCRSAAPALAHVPGETPTARVRCHFPRNIATASKSAEAAR